MLQWISWTVNEERGSAAKVYVDSTQAQVTCEEGASAEQMHPEDGAAGEPEDIFLVSCQ